MAVIIASATGGNWTAGTTWIGGVAPTAADDAVLNAASGPVTINSGSVARSLDATSGVGNYAGTLTHTSGVTLTLGDATAGAGNIALCLSPEMTYTLGNASSSAVSFVSTSATQQTIVTAGKVFGNVTFNGVGGSWILGDALNNTGGDFILTAGTINTGGFTVTSSRFSSTVTTNPRTITMTNSTFNLTRTTAATVWATNSGNLTVNATGSNIVISTASTESRTFTGATKTYGTLTYTVAGSTGLLQIQNSNTFNSINFSDANNARTLQFFAGTTTTLTGSFNVNGTAGKLMTINSSTSGTAFTLSKASGAVSVDYVSIQDSTATGGATWNAGTNSTNVSNNTGWNFSVSTGGSNLLMGV